MACLSPVEMEEYLLEAPSSHNQQMAEHIDNCPRCRSLYLEELEQQARWSQQLFSEALSDSFTSKVMAALEKVDLDTMKESLPGTMTTIVGSDESVTIKEILPTDAGKSIFKLRGAYYWKLIIGAASLLILLSTVIMYSGPTLAETLRSLFTRDNVDIGLLRAQEFGLVEHPNIKVKDKGYTVKIDEAVADPTRVILALQLFGPDGKHEREMIAFALENSIKIRDDKGQIVGDMYDMGKTNDFYYLVANFREPLQTDRITIEGRITQLGNTSANVPSIEGKWNFDFSIDMKEAKKKTTVTPLKGSYSAPDGMTIRLKRLTRMVQGIRLEIDTELNEKALARSPGELWKQQGLKFHFEDMQGDEIHSVNARKGQHKESLMAESHIPGDKDGLMHWSYTFKYLPQETPYTFVLDGYFVSERDGVSVEFESTKLKDQPVPFRFDGDELMLQDFTVESPPNTNGKEAEGSLHLTGRLRNEDSYSQWILRVPSSNKDYMITRRGASTTEASDWKDGYIILGGANLGGAFDFRAKGLTTIPDRIQLIRKVVDRLYTNVDWSITMKEEVKTQ
ncbi:DUF4179 domain-containing protein [Paenibacillus sp. P36]|uniref:DUF4179 domain-containing protein n=1 Tax=Paenibacillus sp. P36 TaxID=3342538 RepID=UPI0038B2CC35